MSDRFYIAVSLAGMAYIGYSVGRIIQPPPPSCDCAEVCARATDGVTAAARERLDLLVDAVRRVESRLVQVDVFVRGPQ